MSIITKEWLRSQISAIKTVGITDSNTLQAFEIALASLEAEPAIHRWRRVTVEPYGPYPWHYGNFIGFSKPVEGIEDEYYYSAPPAPVEDTELQHKAAIHDALCEKYNVESLTDFVDWQRNHIAELEAAPPAPVGKGETAVMPDYPGYALTQRECYQAGKKAGLAELVTTAYKLPDGWVACSERMPEIGIKVLCFPVNDEPIHATYNGQVWLQDISWSTSDEPIDNVISCNVFHWMPLPAAPQQE